MVIDWGGTATERDTLVMALTHFGNEVYKANEAELGRLTLDEVIAIEMATITAPLDEVVAWLVEHVRMRAGFRGDRRGPRSAHRLSRLPRADRADPRARGRGRRVVANHVTADPAGWRSSFPDGPLCAVCGERCKRGAVAGLGAFVYVGDGVSDRCVSLAADRRFARDGLAAWLGAQGVGYEPFDDLNDVGEALRA